MIRFVFNLIFQKTNDTNSIKDKSFVKINTRNQSQQDTQDRILKQLNEKRQSFNQNYILSQKGDKIQSNDNDSRQNNWKSNATLGIPDFDGKSLNSYKVGETFYLWANYFVYGYYVGDYRVFEKWYFGIIRSWLIKVSKGWRSQRSIFGLLPYSEQQIKVKK